MNESPVLLAVESGVARITLNRPEKGNAIDQPMADALLEAALRCASDDAIRCVVLTGAGRMFCVGGDINAFAEAEDIYAVLARLASVVHLAITQFAGMRKPLLTLVNGPAAGAGFSLAIAGDIVLASSSASFTAAYDEIGLTPDGGMTWMLPRLVGLRRAQEIIVTNRRVSAEEAASIGMATRLAADERLAAEGAELAAWLAGRAIHTVGVSRGLLHEGMASSLASQLDREMKAIAAAGSGAEGREGITAFLAKRKPDFTGAQ